MKGKLIVIESGTDASGKATQSGILMERLKEEGIVAKSVSFPNYESESSSLLKMYLRGEFGENPGDVNPYAASVLFAVDRFATYKKEFEAVMKEGGVVLADRYTTSNIVHQAAKIADVEDKKDYIDWLCDLEYSKIGIPKPDLVVFLDLPVKNSFELMENRPNKIDGSDKKDIHERDRDYMIKSYENSEFVAGYLNWSKVSCIDDRGMLRTREEIGNDVWNLVKPIL